MGTGYDEMLVSLREEKQSSEVQLGQLRRLLVRAEQHDQQLVAAIEAIERLQPRSAEGRGVSIVLDGLLVTAYEDNEASRRVPSTDWVSQVVQDAGRPMRPQEIQEAVADRYGIPESWADPASTINVALRRATKRGSVVRTSRGLYSSIAWAKREAIEGAAITQ